MSELVLEECSIEDMIRESKEKAIREVPPITPTKRYLGDGVYVDIDSYGQIQLTTENGIHVHNEIFLDLYILDALNKYVDSMKAKPNEELQSEK